MATDQPETDNPESNEGGAGAPASGPAEPPTDAELDAREQSRSGPRRAAGPPMQDHSGEGPQDTAPHQPPPMTDPSGANGDVGVGGGELESGEGTAGRPADHVGAKPSDDELDRRNRRGAAPRRAAGPPLEDADGGARDAQSYTPPPATDPDS